MTPYSKTLCSIICLSASMLVNAQGVAAEDLSEGGETSSAASAPLSIEQTFTSRMLTSCLNQYEGVSSSLVSAGWRKPDKARYSQFCQCIGEQSGKRFSPDVMQAIIMRDKTADDAEIDATLTAIRDQCSDRLFDN